MPCRTDFYCGTCKIMHDYSCPLWDKKAQEAKKKAEEDTLKFHEDEKQRAIKNILDYMPPLKGNPPAPDSLLCEACELLEDADLLKHASSELIKWYKQHELCEADRLRYEAASKLSTRELRVLGIDLEVLKSKVK